jgi:5,10-methylenetetrahydromethanopterin reductase
VRISLTIFMSDVGDGPTVDAYVAALRSARDEGFRTVWTPQLPGEPDVFATLAVAMREVPDIAVATGVVPIQPRHPMVLAQQALTVSLISGGRLRLGIGLTHPIISEGMYGIPWERNVRRLNEYLDGLLPLLAGEEADAAGELITTRGALQIPGAPPPAVYLAALGPQTLKIAGRRTAGTITYMAGPRTLAEHIVPQLRNAAAAAGRHAEVVAGLPMCVADDKKAVYEFAAEALAVYGAQPSYRAMLDRERVNGPADVVLIGDEAEVMAKLEELSDIGVDELTITVLARNPEDAARTRALLQTASASRLLASGG